MKNLLRGMTIFFAFMSFECLAVSSTTTTTYPDGRIVVQEEFKGVRGTGSTLAIAVVSIAVFGGIFISVLGVRTITKAMKLGHMQGNSDLNFDLNKKSLNFKKVSQGAVIALFGCFVVVLSVKELGGLLVEDSGSFETGSSAPRDEFKVGSPAPD
ncbi:MAG: hypothetical protein ACJA1T_000034 [Zhongshania aliphaticivorans]|jgi:hypothetical protein